MGSRVNTKLLEAELISRGLLPPECRLVEVSIKPNSALVISYEVFVRNDQLSLFADAMKAAAEKSIADDERIRVSMKS